MRGEMLPHIVAILSLSLIICKAVKTCWHTYCTIGSPPFTTTIGTRIFAAKWCNCVVQSNSISGSLNSVAQSCSILRSPNSAAAQAQLPLPPWLSKPLPTTTPADLCDLLAPAADNTCPLWLFTRQVLAMSGLMRKLPCTTLGRKPCAA